MSRIFLKKDFRLFEGNLKALKKITMKHYYSLGFLLGVQVVPIDFVAGH